MKSVISKYIVFGMFFVLTVSGCVRRIELKSPSEIQNEPTTNTAVLAPKTLKSITVVSFQDAAGLGQKIGGIQNMYGFEVGKVITSGNIPEWITNTIASELKRNGYDVKQVVSKGDASGLVLTGQVISVSAASGISYEGVVSFDAQLTQNGKKLLDKPYYGRYSPGLNWFSRAKTYERSLSSALMLAVQNLVTDLYTIDQEMSSGN